MTTQLKVGLLGGMGAMASPMARHWSGDSPVRVLRVHDRGTTSARHEKCRKDWITHGAELVATLPDVVGAGDLDGVFVCCGKNGDDLPLIAELCLLISKTGKPQFICHLSTVGTGFAEAATTFCANHGVQYVNYPLTGGALGAENATMLILASGDQTLFERLAPGLEKLGNPKFFGARPSAGAEVKLIGHVMVFNGLLGICSAAALHAECFQSGNIGGQTQSDFFEFINAGAGGTRQWEIALSKGIKNNIWDASFSIQYAVIDACYTAKLCLDRKLSSLAVRPIIDISLAFSFVANHIDSGLATQAIVREIVRSRAAELDAFIHTHSGPATDLSSCLKKCIESLPPAWRGKVAIEVNVGSFESLATA